MLFDLLCKCTVLHSVFKCWLLKPFNVLRFLKFQLNLSSG